MPYDEKLAARVRRSIGHIPGFSERKMFGGLCFFINGHMCAGVDNDCLFVRLEPGAAASAMGRKYAEEFRPAGRPMRGYVQLQPPGVARKRNLESWLGPAVTLAAGQPPKPKRKKSKKKHSTGN